MVERLIWTFVRGEDEEEQLTIVRLASDDEAERVQLVVTTNGVARSVEFKDLTAATRFQSDMEAFLIKTNWSFVSFNPERRTGRDRRKFPRLHERRRWWTDGMVTLKRFLGWTDKGADRPSQPRHRE